MTTIQQPKNKELTAKQYEFYKRKGMTDDKVMKLHGFNNASFYAWKEANNLKGVKFEKDVKTVKSNDMGDVSSVESKGNVVTYENQSVKARLSDFKPDVEPDTEKDAKQPETSERYEIFNAAELETLGGLSVGEPSPIPLNNETNLLQLRIDELEKEKVWLEERHVREGANADELRTELAKAKERGNDFCDRMLAAERMYREESTKVINLTAQIKRQDELLIAADRDRRLLFMTMEKAVEQNKQIQASVESGEF